MSAIYKYLLSFRMYLKGIRRTRERQDNFFQIFIPIQSIFSFHLANKAINSRFRLHFKMLKLISQMSSILSVNFLSVYVFALRFILCVPHFHFPTLVPSSHIPLDSRFLLYFHWFIRNKFHRGYLNIFRFFISLAISVFEFTVYFRS